jgi:beta-1,4-mannosyl-glycoprotein beta-1,4-N-acetylglucosaminyltransferase
MPIKSSISSKPAITIVTVLKSGPEWQPEYVYRLRDAVARNLSIPHRFVCISDVDLDCETLPLLPLDPAVPGAWGVWYKTQMFRPANGLWGPCLYIDLDTLIRDDFADILAQCTGYRFLMSECPFRGRVRCSALMYWEGDHSDIWYRFQSRELQHWVDVYQHAPDADQRGVEQAFVADTKRQPDFIQDVLDSTMRIDRLRKGPTESSAAILFCSGRRKPWHQLEHPDVRRYWLGKTMIVDTTLFNDEFDMLDIRLALTESWVDRWIICEGNRTLSGQPKPFRLSENLSRYHRYRDRMHVICLDVPESWTNWDIENGQRAAIRDAYQGCAQDDVIMHSDLDEILNPELVPDILAFLEQHDQPVSCPLDFYLYRFDQQTDRGWKGNVVAKKRHFHDPAELYKGLGAGVGHARKRKDRSHCVGFPQRAGWHWGWMGNDEQIRNKIRSCIETQFRDANKMLEDLKRGDTGSAINHKCHTHYVADPGYPESVMRVISQYPYWTHRE